MVCLCVECWVVGVVGFIVVVSGGYVCVCEWVIVLNVCDEIGVCDEWVVK